MIDDVANGIASATAGTGIPTPLVDARLALRAIRTDDAFGSASRWCPDESTYAAAHRLRVIRPALAVRAARGRIARVSDNGRCNTRSRRISTAD